MINMIIKYLIEYIEISIFRMRQDVFDTLCAAEKKLSGLKPEAKRYLERLIKYGKRNGRVYLVYLV